MSAKKFAKPGNPKSKGIMRHNEYGKDKKGIEICPKCWNVYFKKGWHSPNAKLYEKKEVKGKKALFILCPADKMITQGLYEGEIQIQNVPEKYEVELLHLVANYGARAKMRDPQDRIIEIQKTKEGLRITTTENQLAVQLAKKLKSVFKGMKISSIKYSREPYEVARVRASFA